MASLSKDYIRQKLSEGEETIPFSQKAIMIFWLLHVPLGIIVFLGPSMLATFHGLFVLALAAFWACTPTPPVRVAYAGAYIIGSEILWRMAGANLFWEFGKYAIVLVFLLALFRERHAKLPVLPALYLLFLLPSIIPTIYTLGIAGARSQISFNLSGPLSIVVSATFFSRLSLSREQVRNILLALIAPIISVASILFYVVFTNLNIQWTNNSNVVASGGFGPNQVSTILGLGLTAIVLMLLEGSSRKPIFFVLIALGIWFLAQGLLTFSRGGILTGAITAAAALVFQILFASKRSLRRLIPVIIMSVAGLYFLFPALNHFTGGALETRFSDPTMSGRDKLMQIDLQAFEENPITGVGVGLSKSYHDSVLGTTYAAHTEYSRVLAEHGVLGLLAYGLLGIALLSNVSRYSGMGRILILTLSLWAALTLFHSAMRLAAPGYVIGIAFASFELDHDTNSSDR